MDDTDRKIINAMQGDFPLCEEPFRSVAESLEIREAELIERIDAMLKNRTLSRFGPLYQVEPMGGAYVLAAMTVADEDFERAAELVNAMPEVAHNYRREHRLNMWFVVATENAAGIEQALAHIEAETGLKVYAFPKQKEYFVELMLAA